MADVEVSRTPILEITPTTEEGLLADRQKFWGWFTGMITTAVIGLGILLVALLVFLV